MIFVENKKARIRYSILESFEAGIELLGGEVKSLRAKLGKLDGSRVVVRGGEAFLTGMSIPPYQGVQAGADYDPERPRRLLLSKKEIVELMEGEEKKGLTTVPLEVYNKGRYIKVRVAIVKGKKETDRREDIKKRDTERDLARDLKLR